MVDRIYLGTILDVDNKQYKAEMGVKSKFINKVNVPYLYGNNEAPILIHQDNDFWWVKRYSGRGSYGTYHRLLKVEKSTNRVVAECSCYPLTFNLSEYIFTIKLEDYSTATVFLIDKDDLSIQSSSTHKSSDGYYIPRTTARVIGNVGNDLYVINSEWATSSYSNSIAKVDINGKRIASTGVSYSEGTISAIYDDEFIYVFRNSIPSDWTNTPDVSKYDRNTLQEVAASARFSKSDYNFGTKFIYKDSIYANNGGYIYKLNKYTLELEATLQSPGVIGSFDGDILTSKGVINPNTLVEEKAFINFSLGSDTIIIGDYLYYGGIMCKRKEYEFAGGKQEGWDKYPRSIIGNENGDNLFFTEDNYFYSLDTSFYEITGYRGC